MNKKITINNQEIDYKIRKSKRAKRLRVAVYCDASVVVTLPQRETMGIVEKFLHQKSNWLFEKIEYFKKFKGSMLAVTNKDDFIKNKERAYQLALDRVNVYNKKFGYIINKISIKNQKTRWGSCSKKRNLNFNYKIIYLPIQLVDYIVVHELCHLKEFNHSNKFWNLVEKILPEYLETKRQLKRDGLLLK